MAENRFARTLSVAPMMDRTDRHFRYLMRLIAPHAFLYTEMIPARAVLEKSAPALLRFDPSEHPVGIQLGGNDPQVLAQAAEVAEAEGYDEVNLNVGCPSGRVQRGDFGVALMRDAKRVADCLHAMQSAVAIPVTVKTRLGVDDHDSYEFLRDFVAVLAGAQCRVLILHARKAWLDGLSPKENRTVPPLDYPRVHRIKSDFSELEVIINGGLSTPGMVHEQLQLVDGVMLGRAAYSNPMLIGSLDTEIHPQREPARTRAAIARCYLEHMEREHAAGSSLKFMSRHLLGLFAHQPAAKSWRRRLSELPDGREGLRAISKLIGDLADVSDDTAADRAA